MLSLYMGIQPSAKVLCTIHYWFRADAVPSADMLRKAHHAKQKQVILLLLPGGHLLGNSDPPPDDTLHLLGPGSKVTTQLIGRLALTVEVGCHGNSND